MVASKSEEEHLQHLRMLFNRFQEYGVVINPMKCIFGQSEVKFLGYLVTPRDTQPLPARVQALQDFPLKFKKFSQDSKAQTLSGYAKLLQKVHIRSSKNASTNTRLAWSK